MKEYLKHVITFERQVYVWSNSLAVADKQLKLLTNKKTKLDCEQEYIANKLNTLDSDVKETVQRKQEELERCKKDAKRVRRPRKVLLWIGAILFLILFFLYIFKEKQITQQTISTGLFVAISPLIFICAFVFPFGIGDTFSYDQEIKKYTNDLKNNTDENQARRQKVLLNEQCKELETTRKTTSSQLSATKDNRTCVFTSLEKAKKTLNDIYAMGILPQKYRSLNAATTLYEYLETTRCKTIEGHGGIYDTYEYDLKLGLIINKLDDIINHLDRIEQNQYMLYNELRTANQTLSNINQELCSFKRAFDNYATAALEIQRQEAATVQWMAWSNWANGKA